MNPLSRLSTRAWLLLAVLGAFAFCGWNTYWRVQRVQTVTATDQGGRKLDPSSLTGYAGGKRWLIVPEHNDRSYQWIAETQQMLATREWRVRHIDRENAPHGREVAAASPYRWWLATVAMLDHFSTGNSVGYAVERAALWADPLLHGVLLLIAAVYVTKAFGARSGIVVTLALATLFPLAGSFLPAVPSDRSLSLIAALGSLVPLLVARRNDSPDSQRQQNRRFALAGCMGGLGLWLNPGVQMPLIGGVTLGALIGAKFVPGAEDDAAAAWRPWALGGAMTSLLAYLVEYFPDHLEHRLQVNHPLYALAWIGLGELLGVGVAWLRGKPPGRTRGRLVRLTFAAVAITALPVALARSDAYAQLTGGPLATRLADLPNAAVAKNFAAWIARDGLTAPMIAVLTCLPVLALAVARLLKRAASDDAREKIALALGPATIALVLACAQLAWWSYFDVTLVALVAALAAPIQASAAPTRWGKFSLIAFGLAATAGAIALIPARVDAATIEFTRLEVEGLIERSLAHWIADRAGPEGAVVLLPPGRTVSWTFHGGVRGLGTANWENREGLEATIQIITATTAEGAQAQLAERGVTHIVLPSWDTDLDEFARWALKRSEDSFLAALHRWALPPWLRPLPYPLPSLPGFEGQSVALIAVTDETNPASALSRLAEYFVEMQDLERAAAAGEKLKQYPADLGALVARAQVERAQGNEEATARLVTDIAANLTARGDRTLPWDRRVSLAIVLAQAKRPELAKQQMRRCAEKATVERIRSLTTVSLFRFLVLARTYALPLGEPGAAEFAREFLPDELRQRL